MTRKIHLYSEVPSTNKIAFELANAGASHGEVVRARSQSAGRGRLGKAWSSPDGKGLYFSIIVRPRLDTGDYPKLTMTTGLAIASVLEELYNSKAQLKWPNDIMLSGRKCGGILCEAHLDANAPDRQFAIIGVGLNVLTAQNEFPDHLRSLATSLFIETGSVFDLDTMLDNVVDRVLTEIEKQEKQGFEVILDKWKKRDFLKGKWLEWLNLKGEVIFAKAEGPDDEGRLVVRDKFGKLHRVLSGDVTLADKLKKREPAVMKNTGSLDSAAK